MSANGTLHNSLHFPAQVKHKLVNKLVDIAQITDKYFNQSTARSLGHAVRLINL